MTEEQLYMVGVNALIAAKRKERMTNEEAIEILDRYAHHSHSEVITYPREVAIEAYEMAIAALKAEPCEDCVSRQAVLDGVDRYIYKSQSTGTQDDFYSFAELVVKALPPVTPKPLDSVLDEIRAEIRAEIEMYEADCRLQGGTDECEQCNSNVFGSIYRIIDKYKEGENE